MAFDPKTWAKGDVIVSADLNRIEQGIANIPAGAQGPAGEKGDTGEAGKDGATGKAGAAGKDGLSITALALTTDADGKITGGTATLSDKSTVAVTVTAATA